MQRVGLVCIVMCVASCHESTVLLDAGPVPEVISVTCGVDPAISVPGESDELFVLEGAVRGVDPQTVQWEWSVVGAPFPLFDPPVATGPGTATFTPSVSGEWVFELVVTDEFGDSWEPCETRATHYTFRPRLECEGTILTRPGATAMVMAQGFSPQSPFVYKWSVLDDDGSDALVAWPEEPTTMVTADHPGLVQTQVVATDSLGWVTEPCIVQTAFSDGPVDVAIEVEWTLSGDDLDLHLVRESVDGFDEDCFYGTCYDRRSFDWGWPGAVEDNPDFVRDNHDVGPERIEIPGPLDVEETWRVVVEDYHLDDMMEPNEATVTVFVEGRRVAARTVTVVGEGSSIDVFRLDVPSMTATEL